MKSNSKGFTLLELVVVLVIVGIMASLVFASLGRSVTRKRIRLFTQQMLAMCRQARARAITQGVVSTFYISSGDRKYWVDNGDRAQVPEEIKVEGKRVIELEEGLFGIRFFPDGSSSGGALFISKGGEVLFAFRVDMLTGLISPIDGEA